MIRSVIYDDTKPVHIKLSGEWRITLNGEAKHLNNILTLCSPDLHEMIKAS